MKNANSKLEWMDLDLGALSTADQTAAENILSATQELNDMKAKFSANMIAHARKQKLIGSDETLVLAFKFGKVSVAVDKVKAKSNASTKRSFSFKSTR